MLLISIRVCILYLLVVIGFRLMGKRQLGEMQPYELAVTVMISELAAIPISDLDIPIMYGIMAILVLFSLEFFFSMISMRSQRFRNIMNGTPQIIVSNGELQLDTMRTTRININDLLEQMRIQNVYDFNDVLYAVVETNGNLTIIRKAGGEPLTPRDIGLQVEDPLLARSLIIDGTLCQEHLQEAGLSEKFLSQLAHLQGITSLQKVLFAQLTSRGQIVFIPHPEKKAHAKSAKHGRAS